MLNVTIQNNGRIEIQSVCADTKEMRYNVNLLLALASSMETKENVDKKNDTKSNGPSYYLYLNKIDVNNKVETIRTVRDQLKINLKAAKDMVLGVASGKKMMIMQSFDYSAITSVCESLEAKGCTCEITSN